MSHPLLAFGVPPDHVAWTALACGLLTALLAVVRPRLLAPAVAHPRIALGALAVIAALLSYGYVAHYLRGGPRIIDATTYLLQARTLAAGSFAFDVPTPSGSFRGRFLLDTVTAPWPEARTTAALGGLFPPGYPAALALFAGLGVPLLLGPVLAAALVLATAALTWTLTRRTDAMLLGALVSVCSAALRYHTADTMSHGLAALLLTVSATLTLQSPRPLRALAVGVGAGWLFATRPVTGGVTLVAAVAWMIRPNARAAGGSFRSLLLLAVGSIPGAVLVLLQQQALTGEWFQSTQLRYYALADGPPGCFGLGLGARGCIHEHGDVVARFGDDGFTWDWALRNTLHRLHGNALDVANFEPLALLVPWLLWKDRLRPELRWLAAVLAAIVGGYALFYFNGSYAGGGARFFADALPLEHALLAAALLRLDQARWFLPLSLAGFALHAAFSHVHLAERDGGQPMFDATQVRAHVDTTHGALVFVDTDHAFNLGLDPEVSERAARHSLGAGDLLLARRRGDGHDWLLWERLGRPRAYDHHFSPSTLHAESSLRPRHFARDTVQWPVLFHATAQWPALSVDGGWVEPVWTHLPCSDAAQKMTTPGQQLPRRALRVHAASSTWEMRLAVGVAEPGHHTVTWLTSSATEPPQVLRFWQDGRPVAVSRSEQEGCTFHQFDMRLPSGESLFRVTGSQRPLLLHGWILNRTSE